MAFQLSTSSIEKAIRHLCRYGDTDVFHICRNLPSFTARELLS